MSRWIPLRSFDSPCGIRCREAYHTTESVVNDRSSRTTRPAGSVAVDRAAVAERCAKLHRDRGTLGGLMVAVVQLVERQFVVLRGRGFEPRRSPQSSSSGGTPVPADAARVLASARGDAPLAQRQSNGLLIRRFWVRNPGGAQRSTRSDGVIV